uniref:Transmembrane protein n=1 Tax=Caenorhabditis tropicalis TaxID=1561998 RepID=A0A1I7T6U0_9PELO
MVAAYTVLFVDRNTVAAVEGFTGRNSVVWGTDIDNIVVLGVFVLAETVGFADSVAGLLLELLNQLMEVLKGGLHFCKFFLYSGIGIQHLVILGMIHM